jgi:hypothetical protein
MQYKVVSVTHTEEGRVASCEEVNRGPVWEPHLRIPVPVEQYCEPGDIITINVTWSK